MSGLTTVMGPEASNPPSNILTAPQFNAKTDKFQYRRDVRIWYQFVNMSAESGDNKAKGIAGNLGISLYARMAPRYKTIIDSALDIGKLKFTNHDGSKLSQQDQVKQVETILDMIAKETPTDHVRRLVRLNKEIQNCRRKKSESFTEYISRFQSVANAYLSHANASENSQDEQIFAILIIENAGLNITTYNNIIKDLVADSKSNPIEPSIPVELKALHSIRDDVKNAKNVLNPSDVEEGEILTQQSESAKLSQLKTHINNIDNNLNTLDVPNDASRLQEKLRYHISLDKAILALEDMKTHIESTEAEEKPSTSDTPKVGSMLGGPRGYDEKTRNRYYAQKRKSNKARYHNKSPRDNEQFRRKRSSYQHDSDSDGHERPSDDDRQQETRHVSKRLGKRRDYKDNRNGSNHSEQDRKPGKKVHFADQDNEDYTNSDPYFRDQACLEPQLVVCNWEITVTDCNDQPTTFSFDLVNGSSPLVIGLDVARHTDSINYSARPHIRIHNPDRSVNVFNTYIKPDDNNNPECIRIRVNLFPKQHTPITSLLSNISKLAARDPKTFTRRIHRYTHIHPDQLKHLCDRAGILDDSLIRAIDHIDGSCTICARNGRPLPSKKVSLTHVNEECNQEVQVDFTFFTVNESGNPTILKGTKYTILVFTCTGTKYKECELVPRRAVDEIIGTYDRVWLCRHGASKYFSADDEYNKKRLRDFLACHDIELRPRPTRRHNKTGIVERQNGKLKDILRRLIMENSQDNIKTLLARATLFANLFAGSQVLSAFELARGYQPPILGIPQATTSRELLNAHTEQTATRALQRVLRSRTPNVPTPGMFKPDDVVWVWYASTKNNEPNEWIRAQVIHAHRHYLEVKRLKDGKPCRGPSMKPAYEDVRIAPQGELARSLMEDDLETTLGISTEPGEDNTTPTPPSNTVNTMLTKISAKKTAYDDIGPYADKLEKDKTEYIGTLKSEKKRILDDIHNNIGSQQVSRRQLSSAQAWILNEAFNDEFNSNWKDAFIPIHENEVPKNANIISSHTVYKVKTDEEGNRKMKGRIVPHGNRDSEKDNIRKDSSTAQLNIIRLLLSVVTFLGLRLAVVDIKGAYLQSGPIKRDIFVRPPREWAEHPSYKRYTLWKLTKLPYGIVEAGRQWQKVVEDWMLNCYHLERVSGLSQLSIKRDKHGHIVLIIAKVTDDFLIGGSIRQIERFTQYLGQRFTIGKVLIDSKLHFNGCEIVQDSEGNIKLSMLGYIDRIRPLIISRTRRKMSKELVTPDELKAYRSLAGTLLYLVNGVLPQASYVVSLMQQRTSTLLVEHLIEANAMLKELLQLKPWIIFKKPVNTTKVTVCSFTDTSHPRDYGQTGLICGIKVETADSNFPIFHMIDWSSHKQSRVSYSAYGAEILAAATGDDRGYYFKCALASLFPHIKIRHDLAVDSRGLYDTVTTLHEGVEYRLRPTVQRIRNSFESGELDVLRWIPGTLNVADALTKRSVNLCHLLNEMCISGYLTLDLESGYEVENTPWQ